MDPEQPIHDKHLPFGRPFSSGPVRFELAFHGAMLAVATSLFVVTKVGILIAGGTEPLFSTQTLRALALLAGGSVLGTHLLFRPLRCALQRAAGNSTLTPVVRRLPLRSAVLFAILAVAYSTAHLRAHGLPSTPLPDWTLWLSIAATLAVLTSLTGLLAYLLAREFTIQLRRDLWSSRGIRITVAGSSLGPRLITAFALVSILPVAAVVLSDGLLRGAENHHVGDLDLIFTADLVAVLLLVPVCALLMTRGLTVPIDGLVETMRSLGAQRLDARAPVLTDDEFGVLANNVNAMAERLQTAATTRRLFNSFVPAEVADQLVSSNGLLRPRSGDASVLYTDIAGFTRIAEGLPAAKVFELLNEYFGALSAAVNRFGGVITQFQGDAMLASFNLPVAAPAHVDNALQAALEIARIGDSHRFLDGIRLQTRVGVSSGEIVGGTVGGGDRLTYTVHGDIVNLAQRLEALNKRFGTRILVTRRCVEQARGPFDFHKLGATDVPGHAASVEVYALRADFSRDARNTTGPYHDAQDGQHPCLDPQDLS